MDIALWIVAIAAVLLGLAGLVLPLLPGTPLLFGGLWLAAWIDGYDRVGPWTLLALAAVALLAWGVDFAAAALAVKRAGASRRAMAGAGLGAVLGVFGGLTGLILGPVAGAAAGEWSQGRDRAGTARAAVAAGAGYLVAALIKLTLGLAMVAAWAVAYAV